MKRNTACIANVFFIQRASIDILLLNKATAIEICTYLIICKYTDMFGYESGVGFKTIKERTGLGQRKIREAIHRLLSMEFEGQRLLYSKSEWIYLKTGSLPNTKSYIEWMNNDTGWVRGWIESEYKHDVWLNNTLVGKSGDEKRPLNYFVRGYGKDDHARLLLLLLKYQSVDCQGVNLKFASIVYQNERSEKIGEKYYHKSQMAGWHISQDVINRVELNISEKDFVSIIEELIENDFLNISVSVLSMSKVASNEIYRETYVPPVPISSGEGEMSTDQLAAWKKYIAFLEKYAGHRITYRLRRKYTGKGSKTFTIQLKRFYTKEPLKRLREHTYGKLMAPPGCTSKLEAQYMYRLDYKSNQKRRLDVQSCMARRIEEFVVENGLEPASRGGRFYDSYWWVDSQENDARIAGIIIPAHALQSLPIEHYLKINEAEIVISDKSMDIVDSAIF